MKVRVEPRKHVRADEELCSEGRSFSQPESSAINDHESSQLASFVIGIGIALAEAEEWRQ